MVWLSAVIIASWSVGRDQIQTSFWFCERQNSNASKAICCASSMVKKNLMEALENIRAGQCVVSWAGLKINLSTHQHDRYINKISVSSQCCLIQIFIWDIFPTNIYPIIYKSDKWYCRSIREPETSVDNYSFFELVYKVLNIPCWRF